MKRVWELAQGKVWAEEKRCRVCRKRRPKIEAAHVIGREHDRDEPIRAMKGHMDMFTPGVIVVAPDRIVPLCGPATDLNTCHGRYDAHRLDLLPYLTVDEVIQAVADCSGPGQAENGLEKARMRLCPSAYEMKKAG